MIRQENFVKLRNRGVATMAGLSTFVIGGSVAVAQDAQDGLSSAVKADNQVDIFVGTDPVFQRVVNVLLFLVGAISVIMLIVGGIRYIISAGDQNQVTAAKNTIMYAIIGIIVAVLAYGIVNYLLTSLYDK